MAHGRDIPTPFPLEFAVTGDPKPYRRALSDGRGGRRSHPDSYPWKFAVRRACGMAIVSAVRAAGEGSSVASRMGLGSNAERVLGTARPTKGPLEPWFPPNRPVVLLSNVWVLRPRSHYTKSGELKKSSPLWPIFPPDASNYGKEIEDAIAAWPRGKGQPLAYRDDAQVVDSHCIKHYADGCTPGAHVRLYVPEDPELVELE